MSHHNLRRFWFPLTRGFGIGVTAPSIEEARALAEGARSRYCADAEITDEIPDVDVSSLDANHVLPNIGFVVVYGVWFPALNTSGS